jgi:uncharacterized protein YndB with AHSA1/START domain
MVDIVHRVAAQAPIAKVYAALATTDGIAGWWTRNTTGKSQVGGTIKTLFLRPDGSEVGGIEFTVLALETNREVRWRFTENGPAEWNGTDAIFTLSQEGEYTVIRFGHRNWKEEVEFTGHCSTKWATFLLSLKELVETGKGRPAPDDLIISDWH